MPHTDSENSSTDAKDAQQTPPETKDSTKTKDSSGVTSSTNSTAASEADTGEQPIIKEKPPFPIVINHPVRFGFTVMVGVGVALALYFMAMQTSQLLIWIMTALFIALGLDPIVKRLEKRNLPRWAGVLVSVLILGGLVAGFISAIVPTIVGQAGQLIQQAPQWTQDFLNSQYFADLDKQFQIRERATEEVQKFLGNSDAVTGVFGGVVNIGAGVANGLTGVLIVFILTLYFLSSLPAMKNWAYKLAPRSKRPQVESLTEQITGGVGNYVAGQAFVAILNATFAFIVMSFLGNPYAILLASVVVLLAFIPLVGGVTAGVLVTAVTLAIGGWQQAIIYAVLYFGYLQVESYVISPRVMQKAVSVPGAVAVISVIAGGSLLGILGALMAIPTAAAIMLLINELYIKRQDQR